MFCGIAGRPTGLPVPDKCGKVPGTLQLAQVPGLGRSPGRRAVRGRGRLGAPLLEGLRSSVRRHFGQRMLFGMQLTWHCPLTTAVQQ